MKIKNRFKLAWGWFCYWILMIPGAWKLTHYKAFEWILFAGYYGFDECNRCNKSYALKHDMEGNCL